MRDGKLDHYDLRVRVDTSLTEDFRVIQKVDYCGEMTRRVANVAALQMEAGIREQLIRLGWTPPPGPGVDHGG